MKQFITKSILFCIPIAGIFAFPLIIFWLSGELLSMPTVVELQQKDHRNILYQSAFTSTTEKPYKILSTITRNPEVISIGLSRVLSFRSDFFIDEKSFYNAGRGVHNAIDLYNYLDQIPETSRLKVIMLDVSGLTRDAFQNDTEIRENTADMIHGFLVSGWREVYLDYLQGKFTLSDLIKNRKRVPSIGLSALIKQSGYRKDGSFDRGNISVVSTETLNKEIASNILGVINDSSIESKNLEEIDKFLALCRKRNIYVIGYLSPYASKVYENVNGLKNADGNNFRELSLVLSSIFKKNNFHFYDLRDIKMVGSSDMELYDAGHTTEKGAIRLLSYLASRESKLGVYVDPISLKTKIKKEKN